MSGFTGRTYARSRASKSKNALKGTSVAASKCKPEKAEADSSYRTYTRCPKEKRDCRVSSSSEVKASIKDDSPFDDDLDNELNLNILGKSYKSKPNQANTFDDIFKTHPIAQTTLSHSSSLKKCTKGDIPLTEDFEDPFDIAKQISDRNCKRAMNMPNDNSNFLSNSVVPNPRKPVTEPANSVVTHPRKPVTEPTNSVDTKGSLLSTKPSLNSSRSSPLLSLNNSVTAKSSDTSVHKTCTYDILNRKNQKRVSRHKAQNKTAQKQASVGQVISREKLEAESLSDSALQAKPQRKLLLSKARSSVVSSPKKAKYNPRSWREHRSEEDNNSQSAPQPVSMEFDDDTPNVPVPKLRRTVTWPEKSSPLEDPEAVCGLKVSRPHKQLFTVVKNVMQAHECQESGETQEFDDDISYLLGGLGKHLSSSVRCLSAMKLISKTTVQTFRMHIRAHDLLSKILFCLQDSPEHEDLGLCTASLLYSLSRDRINMELDKGTLEMMLRLLDFASTNEKGAPSFQELVLKVHGVIKELSASAGEEPIPIQQITTGNMTLMALLNLTHKKAGDWFKDDLRNLGGLDHIVNSIIASRIWLAPTKLLSPACKLEPIRNMERCLRVLENVTYINSENQDYLISFKGAALVSCLAASMSVCLSVLRNSKKSAVFDILLDLLLSVFRVLCNLTHDNSLGSSRVGRESTLLPMIFQIMHWLPTCIAEEKRFDLIILALSLLINMVESCQNNRRMLLKMDVSKLSKTDKFSTLKALAMIFSVRFETAQKLEAEQDAERKHQKEKMAHDKQERGTIDLKNGDDEEEELDMGSKEMQENFTKALNKAGRHMEDSIIAAYVALLTGILIQNRSDLASDISKLLPSSNFDGMVLMLRKFLGFMNFTVASNKSSAKVILKVIDTLEAF